MVRLAIPLDETNVVRVGPQVVPPTRGWRRVSSAPGQDWDEIGDSELLVRRKEGSDEFWTLARYEVMRYRDETGMWESVGGLVPDLPAHLLLSKDRDVWLWGTAAYQTPEDLVPPFGRYDDTLQLFEPVYDAGGLLNGLVIRNVQVDEDGIFWILADSGSGESELYRFEPTSLNAQAVLPGRVFHGMAVAPGPRVFLLDRKEGEVLEYHPGGGVTNLPIPFYEEFGDSPISMMVDHEGRLWINDFEYLDLSSMAETSWFRIIRSPIFINYLDTAGIYHWDRPAPLLETPDGSVWFASGRGTARLDPLRGEWCMFTSAKGGLAQDLAGNLWMFAYGGLYLRQAGTR